MALGGAMLGTAFVEVRPDLEGFGRTVQGQLGPTIERHAGDSGGRAGRSWVSTFGGAISAIGVTAGLHQAVDFLSDSVGAFREAEEASARLQQTLANMGQDQGVAARVQDYASSLGLLTATSDETIMAGQAILATFSNVAASAGDAGGNFDRATQAAVDLAAAGFGSVESNAVSLGKALQDPAERLSSLTRQGVDFTDEQKHMIEAMVAAGDVAGAQEVILANIERQVAGTGEATATEADRMAFAWGEAQEALGEQLMPIMSAFARFASNTLIPIFSEIVGGISAFASAFSNASDGVTSSGFAGFMERLAISARGVWDTLVGGIQAFASAWQNASDGVTSSGFAGTMEEVAIALRELFDDARPFIDWLRANWKPVLLAAGAALLLVTAPVTTVVAALVLAYAKFEWFRDAVNAAVRFIVDYVAPAFVALGLAIYAAVDRVVTVVLDLWQAFGDEILAVLDPVLTIIGTMFETAFGVVRGIFDAFTALFRGDWQGLWDALVGIFQTFVNYFLTLFRELPQYVLASLNLVKEVLLAAFRQMWELAKGLVSTGVSEVLGLISSLPGQLLGFVGAIAGAAVALGTAILTGIRDGITGAIGGVIDLATTFTRALKDAWNWIVGQLNRAWNAVEFSPGFGITIGLPDNALNALRLHSGGIVPGRPGVDVPALLRAGEWVLTPEQMAALGQGNSGPAVAIGNVTMAAPVDVDLLVGRLGAAVAAGRL